MDPIVVLCTSLLTCGLLWRAAGSHVLTLVHESGHALVAILLGSVRITVRVNPDGSGRTDYWGPTEGLVSSLAGYLSPPMLGLLVLWVSQHLPSGVLLVGLLPALAVVLLMIRSWFGLVLVLALVAVDVLGLLYATPWGRREAVVVLGWVLLVGSLRNTGELLRGGDDDDDDAAILAERGRLPRRFWVVLFFVVSVLAMGLALWLAVVDSWVSRIF